MLGGLAAAALSLCLTAQSAAAASPAAPVTSDVSQLERLGSVIGKNVLIDVADDGEDRFLEVGFRGLLDFTGTDRSDTTMMSLKPAATAEKNRVVIRPPFWNEDLGDGYCAADTPGSLVKLEVCRPDRAEHIWHVVPAGDSGQFELHGRFKVIRVDEGRITTGPQGRTGLQTIPYADY